MNIVKGPLIVRVGGTDVTIGHVEFTDGAVPEVTVDDRGVQLAAEVAAAIMTAPFGGQHGEGS
jgi:hypothetical protein